MITNLNEIDWSSFYRVIVKENTEYNDKGIYEKCLLQQTDKGIRQEVVMSTDMTQDEVDEYGDFCDVPEDFVINIQRTDLEAGLVEIEKYEN